MNLLSSIEHPVRPVLAPRFVQCFVIDLERPWVLYDQARRCFEKALEIDALAEGFYRSLMQINLAAGGHAQALSVYRRCRKILALHFHCAPSTKIEASMGLIDKV